MKMTLAIIFILIQIGWFVLMHFTGLVPYPWNFFAIVTCLVAAIIFAWMFKRDKSYKAWLIVLGLSLTVIADLWLVVLYHMHQRIIFAILGVLFFLFTQLTYMTFLHDGVKSKRFRLDAKLRAIIAFILACVAVAINAAFLQMNYLLVIIGAVYIINLVMNIVFAWVNLKNRRYYLFFVGLVFFLACDIFVAMSFAGLKFNINWAWIFYIPSQTLIALSVLQTRKPT